MCKRKRFAIAIPWQRVFNSQVMHINSFRGGLIVGSSISLLHENVVINRLCSILLCNCYLLGYIKVDA